MLSQVSKATGFQDEVIENAYACARKFFGLSLEEKRLGCQNTGPVYPGSADCVVVFLWACNLCSFSAE